MEFFGKNLKYLRKQAAKSQDQVASDLKYQGRGRIANYEAGLSSPNVADLVALAKYYNVTIDDLLLRDISVPVEEKIDDNTEFLTLQIESLQQRIKTLQQLNNLLSTDNQDLLTNNEKLLTMLKAAQEAEKTAVKATKGSNKK